MLPLLLSLTLVLGAGALVYAMRVRRELSRLASTADAAWLSLDDVLTQRRDHLCAELNAPRESAMLDPEDAARLTRALELQDAIRHTRDLLRLGSLERQIRTLTERARERSADRMEDIAALERDILARTDTYDALASLYNIRLQRFPGRLLALLEQLDTLPLIEFVEPFGQRPDAASVAGTHRAGC